MTAQVGSDTFGGQRLELGAEAVLGRVQHAVPVHHSAHIAGTGHAQAHARAARVLAQGRVWVVNSVVTSFQMARTAPGDRPASAVRCRIAPASSAAAPRKPGTSPRPSTSCKPAKHYDEKAQSSDTEVGTGNYVCAIVDQRPSMVPGGSELVGCDDDVRDP